MKELREKIASILEFVYAQGRKDEGEYQHVVGMNVTEATDNILALLPKRVEVTPAGVAEVMAKAFDEDVPVNTVLANWFNNLGKESER